MRDLSGLPEAHYDRVYQPISTLFVPDLREVYREVAQVLKPGGLYSADYAVPLLYMAEDRGWDGKGYTLHITEPYMRGAILETEDERMNFTEGESYSEFHHLLSDIINSLSLKVSLYAVSGRIPDLVANTPVLTLTVIDICRSGFL